MKSNHVRSPACVHTALFEIAQAVKVCEMETDALEECINSWIASPITKETPPIVQLQRLDYLRQMQRDIHYALLYMSQNRSGVPEIKDSTFDVSDLVKNLHLGELKERILRATSSYQDLDTDTEELEPHSSDVQLFFEG